ncbi:hypothetical protein [Streptomyces sp. SYSU K21746]
MATSAVPAAINAILALLRAEAGLSGVQVIDGPPTLDMADSEIVVIGWQDGGEQAVEEIQQFAYAGARSRDSDFSIACWLDTWSGDNDIGVRRARAYELLAVVENALRASVAKPAAPALGGVVQWAHITRIVLRQDFNNDGVQASLAFTITCRARI